MSQKEAELYKKIQDLEYELSKLKKKKYGLVWEDKPEKFEKDSENALPVLREKGGKFKDLVTNPEEDFNILIEGDNYHALSILSYTHRGKVDVIYIDPPYNTGNRDFMYNDRYVDKESPYRHSKWLSFMSKRLKLAKNLLKDNAIMFVSIDDNEQAQLKILCDEIFGAINFLGMISVQSTPGGRQSAKNFAVMGDYVLVYGKSMFSSINGLPLSEKRISQYKKEDMQGKYLTERLRQHGIAERREDVPSLYFPIYYNENSNEVSLDKDLGFTVEILPTLPSGGDGRWIWSRSKVKRDKNLLEVRKVNRNGGNVYDVFFKKYLNNDLREKFPTIWIESDVRTEVGSKELREIFGGSKVFDFPKPTYFIKRLLQSCTRDDSLVLDFMAGSGSTGHAILQLNNEDGGQRKCILCTNNENNICENVTYERIKRVSKGYKNKKGEKVAGLGGNLKYLKTDFIKIDKTLDNLRKNVAENSTEILCLKEGTFNLVKDQFSDQKFKIFENGKKYTAILFDTFYFEEFLDEVKKLKKKVVSIYVFSYTNDFSKEEFGNLDADFTIEAIPEKLLEIYKKTYNF